MVRQTDIAIIGAGVGGLTLAMLLSRKGLNVDIVDHARPPPLSAIKPSGRTAALFGHSIDIIKATGVWDKIAPFCAPMRTMRIMDEGIETSFYADDYDIEEFGYNIPNDILRSALFEAAEKEKTIFVHAPAQFKNYTVKNNHVLITLEDGPNIQTPLIVGADGRNSKVRTIANIGASERPYGQSAMTFLINHSRTHENISTEFHRPGGPLAFVPMPGNQSSVVWVEKTDKAEDILKLKKQEFEQALQDASQDILGGITLETGPQSWPLCYIKANKLTAPRMALVAEAAHVIPPITAQGLNLSLRDVEALADLVSEQALVGMDIGGQTLLDSYEKRRRLDIKTRTFGVDTMNRMVGNDNKAVQSARRLGLKTLESLSPFKQLLVKAGLR